MKTPIEFALISFSSVFAMVDPIATAPLFVDMTKKIEHRRKQIAIRACMAAGITLLLFAVAGSAIFKFFGITVPAFQIVGGLLLSISAIRTLHGVEEKHSGSDDESNDPSIVPLGIPLIAGAGSISTVMVLAGQARERMHQIALSAAILVTIAISFVVFLLAPRLVAKLGKSGQQIMSRVLALLTAVIGVQFILNGFSSVIAAVLAK